MAASLGEIAQVQEQLGKHARGRAELPRSAEPSARDRRQGRHRASRSSTWRSLLQRDARPARRRAAAAAGGAADSARHSATRAGEALVLNNIGSVYLAKGQYSEAQTYFERALEIREKAKVPRRDGRHAAQSRRDARRRWARTTRRWRGTFARSSSADGRRQARRRDRVVQHRHDFRLSGPLRRGHQVQGRGA